MSRKEELERIIAEATAELKPLKERETYLRWTKSNVEEARVGYLLTREDLISIVDEVYDAKPVEPVGDRRENG